MTVPGKFYRVCSEREYLLMKDYFVLEDNEYDKRIGGMEIFKDSETLLKKYNTQGLVVLEMTGLNVSTDGTSYISICPICKFQITNVFRI